MNPTWDERYSSCAYAHGTESNTLVAAMASRIPAGLVLCLAEGEGRNAVHLAPRPRCHRGRSILRRLAKAARNSVPLTTVVADLAHDAIEPSAWTGIVTTWAHLPPPLRRAVHAQVVTGLRPGGGFILEADTPVPIAFGTGGPKDPSLCMTLVALRDELAGLDFDVARECEREVIEGSCHTGRVAVVQVVARRPGGARAKRSLAPTT